MQMGGRKTTTLQAAFFILLIRFEDNGGGVVPSRATASGAGGGGCPLTQFRCATGRCVNLNVFCDGRNDCGDNSDEPAQCTHCNRTYYAGTGESYRLLVAWPKPNQMPFLCYLTFTSATHDPSELLQVRLDTATIGQYLVQHSGDINGRCPDGCMQIWEGDQPVLQQLPSSRTTTSGGSGGGGQSGSVSSRQPATGSWCGASITPRFYYTDSTAVTFVLRLVAIPASLQTKALLMGSTAQPHPVLDLTYKVLPRSAAIVRYGQMDDVKVHLGDAMAGKVCSRSFHQCGGGGSNESGGQGNNHVQCRVQSPGYPGIYPRNAHCLYRVTHRPVSIPGGAAASTGGASGGRRYVVVLWQNDGRKINLRDWDQPVEQHPQQQRTRSAGECEASGDYITVYDGTSTASPILARFCDGPLPEVVSSGPDVTIEFRSSPVDTIYAGSTTIEGFELKVRIAVVSDPQLLSPSLLATTAIGGDAGKCQWNVTSSGLSRGLLTAPQQTWPLQTTCHFRFLGRPDERVWIYFAKYHFVGTNQRASSRSSSSQQCRNVLRIAEGDGSDWDPAVAVVNGTIRFQPPSLSKRGTVGLFCRDRPPPLCERQLTALLLASTSNQSRAERPPPCLAGESFISEGSTLSVQQHLPEGTAFSSWKYALAYEFFRENQDGRPLNFTSSSSSSSSSSISNRLAAAGPYYDCNRLFSVQQQAEPRGSVKSPQNVFLFGRGGAKNLKCVYQFQGDETMRVAIEVTRLRLGGRQCRSVLDPLTHHRRCNSLSAAPAPGSGNGGNSSPAFLQIRERPWGRAQAVLVQQQHRDVLLQRDCLCDTGLLPFRFVSTGSTVQVVFQVDEMSHADDYHDFFFEISYEFLSGMKCASQSELRPLQGPGGFIALDGLRGVGLATSPNACNRQSWFLLPRPDRFLFLSTNGFAMNQSADVAVVQDNAAQCPTKNRILVYSGGSPQGQPLAIICPLPSRSSGSSQQLQDGRVKIFSPTYGSSTAERLDEDLLAQMDVESDDGWWRNESLRQHRHHGSREEQQQSMTSSGGGGGGGGGGGVVIEFIAIQSGSYRMKWLELTPQAVVNPAGSVVPLGSVSSPPHPSWLCSTWCPELKACVDSQLWCDGVYDCPSGLDESDQQCHSTTSMSHPGRSWSIPKVYWYLMAAGSTLLSLFVIVSSVLVCRGGNKPLPSYETNGDLLSPTSPMVSSTALAASSSAGGGSFRPPPIAALNDYVYPDSSVSGISALSAAASSSHSVVGGGGGGGGPKLVLERSHYDKKMAVS